MFQPAFITAAIPCYNAEKHIGAVIASLLRQTKPADEILVIDDGSTDNSASITKTFPEVTLIQHTKNKGIAEARNTALYTAKGDIIIFVDSDAPADNQLIERIADCYTEASVAGVGGQAIEVNRRHPADFWRGNHNTRQSFGEEIWETAPFLYGVCSSYRTDKLREIGGYNPSFRSNAEDVEIGIRIRRAGYRMRYNPEIRVYHHRKDDYITVFKMIRNYKKFGTIAMIENHEKTNSFYIKQEVSLFMNDLWKDVTHLKNPVQFMITFLAFWISLLTVLEMIVKRK